MSFPRRGWLQDSSCQAGAVPPVPLLAGTSRKSERMGTRQGRTVPGIGKGPLIQIGAAMEAASEMRTAYPSHYW